MAKSYHFIISAVFLLISFSISFGQSVIRSKKIKIEGKEYYLHKVEKGEGLYRIAKNYQVSQEEIINSNPDVIVNKQIQLGQVLYIPIIEGRNTNIESSIQKENFIYHTIQQGQTIYFLSKKYGVTLDEIYTHNPECKTSVRLGQVVKIPLTDKKSEVVESNKYFIHTVSPQETVYGISKRYNVPIQKLVEENPGISDGVVVLGSELRIPKNITVKKEVDEQASNELSDKSYVYHSVSGGETIYSIAKTYNVSISEIEKANPGINQSELPVGYVIRLPKYKPLKNQNLLKSSYLKKHKVSRKETLFGIAKEYNTEIDFIKKLNPSIDFSNLRKGTILKIPTRQWLDQYYTSLNAKTNKPEKDTSIVFEEVDCDYNYFDKNEMIDVAIMLPFNVSQLNKQDDETGELSTKDVTITGRTKIVLEFYEGFLMAVDEIKNRGVHLNLKVYDTGTNGKKLRSILQNPDLKNSDLIVGPAHSENIKVVSDFSKANRIAMINPFTTSNPELANNPFMFQLNTPDTLLVDKLSSAINDLGENRRVLFFKSGSETDLLEEKLEQSIKSKLFWSSFQNNTQANMIDVAPENLKIDIVETLIQGDADNVIVIPSNDVVFVNKVINILNAIYEKGARNLFLVGLPDWLKFDSVDPEYIHRLNGNIFSHYGVDYSKPYVQDFIVKYRELYSTEPMAFNPYFQKSGSQSGFSRYGIWGYDVATYFLNAIVQYGPEFELCISDFQPQLIQSNFHFSRTNNWSGFYNDGLKLLHFTRDYSVKSIPVKF